MAFLSFLNSKFSHLQVCENRLKTSFYCLSKIQSLPKQLSNFFPITGICFCTSANKRLSLKLRNSCIPKPQGIAIVHSNLYSAFQKSKMKTVQLLSGHEMPIVGLGTWQAKPEEIENAVMTALESGYRHIDTAFNYNNEEAIGKSLKSWIAKGGKREDLFITSKLPHYGNRSSDVEKYLTQSLEKLGLNYLDMYLVHMPFATVPDETGTTSKIQEDGSFVLDLNSDIVAVWKEMENQVKKGRVKSIGLSNFNEEQILRIWNNAQIKPSNLQVELHAYIQQKPLREFCGIKNIVMTGYSPLGSPGAKVHFKTKYNYNTDQFPDLLGHPVVKKIAEAHKKTTAQILLRHLIQGGVVVIPKSASVERVKANIEIFDFNLNEEEVKELDGLDRGTQGRIFNFLFFKGIENHPEYPFKGELKGEV